MSEEYQIKRIAIIIAEFVLCAFVAWLFCVCIVKLYNSGHSDLVVGILFIIQTLILYYILKMNKDKLLGIIPTKCKNMTSLEVGTNESINTLRIPKLNQIEILNNQIEELRKEVDNLNDKIKNEYILISDHKKYIEDNYISRDNYETLRKQKLRLDAEKEEIYLPALSLNDTLLDMAKQLQYAYSKLNENNIDQKELIEHIIKSYCRFEHYNESNKEYFKAEGSRPREASDSPNQQIIETCPALFVDKTNECISLGKYVILTD